MEEYIKKIVFNLMRYRREDSKDTKVFRDMKHNSDLCPSIHTKLDSIINSFGRYRNITYDIQGINDRGTDILIKLINEDVVKYICFQIKSQDDLKDQTYLTKLKAQVTDTMESYYCNLLDYYILICCDTSEKLFKDKTRMIQSSFTKNPNIHVIEPEYVLSFINLGHILIDAFIKSSISDEDIITKEAKILVDDLVPTERALILCMIYLNFLKGEKYISELDLISSQILDYIYDSVPNCSRDWFFNDEIKIRERSLSKAARIAADLDFLLNRNLICVEIDQYWIFTEQLLPVIALMIDGYFRYEYTQDQTILYMLELLGPIKGLIVNS